MLFGDDHTALTRETIQVEGLPRDGKLWRVVWYCGIDRNEFSPSEPRVLALLAFASSKVVEHRVARIGLTNLGIVRIGTRWRNGGYAGSVRTRVFQGVVDVSSETSITPAFLRDLAQIHGQFAATNPVFRAVEFKSAISVTAVACKLTIIIPALELFSRCFGTSQFVKRTLATYSYRDAINLLTIPDRISKSEIATGHQLITLSKRCVDSDGPFIAQMKFDSFARRRVSDFCGSIQAFDDRRPNAAFFPNVSFWWRKPTLMRLRGICINEGGRDTFLCYRIEGMEEIDGPPLTIDRENSNLVNPDSRFEIVHSIDDNVVRIPSPPRSSAIVHSSEPSSDFAFQSVAEQPLVIMNPKREIVRARSATAGRSKKSYISIDRSADAFSGADFGTQSSTVAPAVIRYSADVVPVDAESAKVFSALRAISSAYQKTRSTSLEVWSDMLFQPFDAALALRMTDYISTKPAPWYFIKHDETSRARSFFVNRLTVSSKSVVFIDFERRSKRGKLTEHLLGVACSMPDDKNIRPFLKELVRVIGESRGVFREIETPPGVVIQTYKHPESPLAMKNRLERIFRIFPVSRFVANNYCMCSGAPSINF